jgi:predicted transcriptional regulator
MAKLSMPAEAAAALRVSERMLLFCVASNTDWQHTTIPGEIVTTMVVKGLIERDAGGHLSLTDRGRAILRAMLPDL